MAGGASTPCIRIDLWEMLPAKSDGLWESIQPHAQTLFGAVTCPVQNDVMNMYRHLDVLSPNNKDGRGSFGPMHQSRPWGDPPPQNQMACGKAKATCRDFVWGRHMPSAERCDESIFQHADCRGGWCMAWRERFNNGLMMGTDPR